MFNLNFKFMLQTVLTVLQIVDTLLSIVSLLCDYCMKRKRKK